MSGFSAARPTASLPLLEPHRCRGELAGTPCPCLPLAHTWPGTELRTAAVRVRCRQPVPDPGERIVVGHEAPSSVPSETRPRPFIPPSSLVVYRVDNPATSSIASSGVFKVIARRRSAVIRPPSPPPHHNDKPQLGMRLPEPRAAKITLARSFVRRAPSGLALRTAASRARIIAGGLGSPSRASPRRGQTAVATIAG